jgi:hypothetical protein
MKDVIGIHKSEKRDAIFSACAGIHNLRTIFRNI